MNLVVDNLDRGAHATAGCAAIDRTPQENCERDGGGSANRWRPAQGQRRMHQRGDGEASDQIDDECAVGERATEPLRRPQRDQMTGAGPRRG